MTAATWEQDGPRWTAHVGGYLLTVAPLTGQHRHRWTIRGDASHGDVDGEALAWTAVLVEGVAPSLEAARGAAVVEAYRRVMADANPNAGGWCACGGVA